MDTQPTTELPAGLAAEIDTTAGLPGFCSRRKAVELAGLVLRERPGVVVEVGVFGGRSLLPVALACRHAGAGVVYGVDAWDNGVAAEGDQADHPWWPDTPMAAVHARFCRAVTELGLWPWVRVLHAPSERVACVFGPGSIDLLHVDGNHSTEVAGRDLRLFLPLVRPGGLVAVDDTDWPSVRAALGPLEVAGLGRRVLDGENWRVWRR